MWLEKWLWKQQAVFFLVIISHHTYWGPMLKFSLICSIWL